MKPKIIVMQTVDSTLQQCREILISMGLIEGEDFLLLDQAPNIENFEPDSRQLFVTGSFSGLDSGVAEMVTTAKDQNKELVAISFSTHKIAGTFDAHIPKVRESLDACFRQFRGIVQRFLDGTLVRTA